MCRAEVNLKCWSLLSSSCKTQPLLDAACAGLAAQSLGGRGDPVSTSHPGFRFAPTFKSFIELSNPSVFTNISPSLNLSYLQELPCHNETQRARPPSSHTSTIWFYILPDTCVSQGFLVILTEGIGRHTRQDPQMLGNSHLVTALRLGSPGDGAGCQIPVGELVGKASNWDLFQSGVLFHGMVNMVASLLSHS